MPENTGSDHFYRTYKNTDREDKTGKSLQPSSQTFKHSLASESKTGRSHLFSSSLSPEFNKGQRRTPDVTNAKHNTSECYDSYMQQGLHTALVEPRWLDMAFKVQDSWKLEVHLLQTNHLQLLEGPVVLPKALQTPIFFLLFSPNSSSTFRSHM